MVYNATARTFEDNATVSIDKELPAAKEETALAVKESLKPILEAYSGINVSISAKIGAGDHYRTISGAVKMGDMKPSDMTHQEGEVTLIDFWATWCPPCQGPMQHNVDMIKKNQAEWKGKVRIVGLSIDNEMSAVEEHVKTKDWGNVEHWHRDKSDCSKVYGVNGVPHVMLLDKKGKIVFKGHPASRKNLEQDMNDLMNGKELTGEGTAPANGNGDEGKEEKRDDKAIPEGFSEMKKEEVDKECEEHAKVMEAWKTDEDLATTAKECPRAFCVIVLVENYYPESGNTYFKYDNFRVVVGAKENIEKLKTTFADKMKGTFNPIIREHAV